MYCTWGSIDTDNGGRTTGDGRHTLNLSYYLKNRSRVLNLVGGYFLQCIFVVIWKEFGIYLDRLAGNSDFIYFYSKFFILEYFPNNFSASGLQKQTLPNTK